MKRVICGMAGIMVVFFSSTAFAVEESNFYVDDDEKVVIVVPSCEYEKNFYSFLLISKPNLEGMYFEITNIEELSFWDVASRRLTFNAAAIYKEKGEEMGIKIHVMPINDINFSLFISDLGGGVFQLTDWMHENLKFYGPAFTAVDGIGKEGGYIEEVSFFSNLAMIGSACVEDDIAKIKEAASCGMKSIVVIPYDIFFKITWDENGQLINVELNPDRKEEWLKYREQIQPVKKEILGFFLFDEMYWVALQCGIPFGEIKQMMEEAASAIKARFPKKKVIGTIAITEIAKPPQLLFPIQHSVFGYIFRHF